MTQVRRSTGLSIVERPKNVEASLWRRFRYEQDIECRSELFYLHQSQAKKLARRQFNRRPNYGLTRSDFEQLAYEGLLESLDRYDPLKGVPFPAYCKMRILGTITDGINRSSESAAQYRCRKQIERERLKSIQAGSDEKGKGAVGQFTDLVVELAIGIVLEETAMIADENKKDPGPCGYESLAWKQLQSSIRKALSNLERNLLIVIEQHYIHGAPFKIIAEILKVTPARVSQLHAAGLKAMRDQLSVFI